MTKSDVLKAVSANEELTATAVAKRAGLSKANDSFKSLLDELIQDGSITRNTSGRFETYKKVFSVEKKTEQQGVTSKTVVETMNPELPALPAAPDSKVSGYSVKKVKEKGVDKLLVTLPDGRVIKINATDNLIVINGEPQYIVKSAKDVFSCIKEYTTEKGMKTFTVDDICENKKIGTENDIQINDNHVVFLSIQKHNKAAVLILEKVRALVESLIG